MIKLTALWLKRSKDDESYMSGNVGDANIIIMRNKYKKSDNHPDYIVYITEPQKKDGTARERKEDIPL